ncbi:hypothetical protein [Paenibacillus sp. IHBB 3054]|uniref:hypothetical protein n=1 Tax=Paenibacillus sp. IHBB 3054 TaxID=3425689 RepID=UPI003F66AB05
MRAKLEGITVLALDVPVLTRFYRDILGFKVIVEEGHYTEFENDGVRLRKVTFILSLRLIALFKL